MNRRIDRRMLRLSKETLRTLNAQELVFAAGATGGNTYTVHGSLSGTRKCHTGDCNSWGC